MGKHDIGSEHNRIYLSSELGYDRAIATIKQWPKHSGRYPFSDPRNWETAEKKLVTEKDFFDMRKKIGASYEK